MCHLVVATLAMAAASRRLYAADSIDTAASDKAPLLKKAQSKNVSRVVGRPKAMVPTIAHREFRDAEIGAGTPEDPLQLPLRQQPNASGCFHCPTEKCQCNAFMDAFDAATSFVDMKRVVEVAGNNALCAKSLNPCFVARLSHLLDIRPTDTFYDLGSGNGSILFQMAFITGAECVGVEISKHNAEVARRTWDYLRPMLEDIAGRPMPKVTIVTGDLADLIMRPEFAGPRPVKVLTSNLLLPLSLTHFMSERFRSCAVGSRFACFNDLYPHGRACSRTRDPEAFELFAMTDCIWPRHSVEWCSAEGKFYVHQRV